MSTHTWYVDIDFTHAGMAEDIEFDVLEQLAEYAAVISVAADRNHASVSLSIEATGALEAATGARKAVEAVISEIDVTAIEVTSEEVRKARVFEPSIPELVGYAEIAEIAGVSRTRARELAEKPDFPSAVVETAAGPLRIKEAVEAWVAGWDRTPGRPKKLATV